MGIVVDFFCMEVFICTCEMDAVRAHRWSQQNNGHVELEGLGE